jgi:hypothetical protein
MPNDAHPQLTAYDKESIRVFLSREFLAILAETARIYMRTEKDVGLCLPADLWNFVEWCEALSPLRPHPSHRTTGTS